MYQALSEELLRFLDESPSTFHMIANIACLLLNNLSGFAKFLNIIDSISYMFIATGLSCAGIICFLVFRIFYRITDEVCLHHTD